VGVGVGVGVEVGVWETTAVGVADMCAAGDDLVAVSVPQAARNRATIRMIRFISRSPGSKDSWTLHCGHSFEVV